MSIIQGAMHFQTSTGAAPDNLQGDMERFDEIVIHAEELGVPFWSPISKKLLNKIMPRTWK